GVLPFGGSIEEMLAGKEHGALVSPRTLAPCVPPDLDSLCVGLLARDPAQRLAGDDVLRCLDSGALLAEKRHAANNLFIGRGRELSTLTQALDDVQRAGRPVTVFVEGESGVGKSALVRTFLSQVSGAQPNTML